MWLFCSGPLDTVRLPVAQSVRHPWINHSSILLIQILLYYQNIFSKNKILTNSGGAPGHWHLIHFSSSHQQVFFSKSPGSRSSCGKRRINFFTSRGGDRGAVKGLCTGAAGEHGARANAQLEKCSSSSDGRWRINGPEECLHPPEQKTRMEPRVEVVFDRAVVKS